MLIAGQHESIYRKTGGAKIHGHVAFHLCPVAGFPPVILAAPVFNRRRQSRSPAAVMYAADNFMRRIIIFHSGIPSRIKIGKADCTLSGSPILRIGKGKHKKRRVLFTVMFPVERGNEFPVEHSKIRVLLDVAVPCKVEKVQRTFRSA